MITIRFYRTARIGDGISRPTAFRSALTRYIMADRALGTDFHDWVHDARPIRYAVAWADPAVHAQVILDPDGVLALSPEFPADSDANAWLDASALGDAILGTQCEADGIHTGWISAQNTRRDLFRYMSHLHVATQECRRLRSEALQLYAADLDAPFNSLPPAIRTAVKAWMAVKGLDADWIGPTTAIRPVLHALAVQVAWPTLPLGPFRF